MLCFSRWSHDLTFPAFKSSRARAAVHRHAPSATMAEVNVEVGVSAFPARDARFPARLRGDRACPSAANVAVSSRRFAPAHLSRPLRSDTRSPRRRRSHSTIGLAGGCTRPRLSVFSTAPGSAPGAAVLSRALPSARVGSPGCPHPREVQVQRHRPAQLQRAIHKKLAWS